MTVRQNDPRSLPRGEQLSQTEKRCFALTQTQASDWLQTLHRLERESSCPAGLSELIQSIEDACWLARWKREAPIAQFSPTMLAEVVSALIELSHSQVSSETVETLEGITQVLTASADQG